MYPYNRALNRSLRRGKPSKLTDVHNCSNMFTSDLAVEKESDIVWDPAEYKLTYLLDNFQLPQIVRVVEGFMLSEDDSLASGTLLTIHGQQTIKQICGKESQGLSRDINIPLHCPYKVKLTVPNKDHIYRTIKDLCNASPLPKCVIVQKKISASGMNIPPGRSLVIHAITRNHVDEAFGLMVSTADNELNSFVLQLKVEGNFRPCPFPRDQSRYYFIRELADRPFPIWVEFAQSAEKNAPYGPQLGVVKLSKLVSSNVVFATSIIDSERYAISFSRDLPVTIEIARGMLDNTATYTRKCKAAKEQVDLDVLSHLTESNPYADEFRSSIYEDVKALREAFKLKQMMKGSSNSSDSKSVSSDVSYGEDAKSLQDQRYIMTYRSSDLPSSKNGSHYSRTSQGRETASSSSADNLSLSSVGSRENPAQREQLEIPVDAKSMIMNQADIDQDDYDSGDDGYEKVADWMDRPAFSTTKSSQDENDPDYNYPEWVIGAALKPLDIAPDVAPRLPNTSLTKSLPSSGGESSGKSPYSTRRSSTLSLSKDDHDVTSQSHFACEYHDLDTIRGHIPETLDTFIPSDGFFSLLDKSDGISIKSDEMSIISDYRSVKSERDSDCSSDKFFFGSGNICEEFHVKDGAGSKTGESVPASTIEKADLKKPEVPNRPRRAPPIPVPRRGKSVNEETDPPKDFSKRKIEKAMSLPSTNLPKQNSGLTRDFKEEISGSDNGPFELNAESVRQETITQIDVVESERSHSLEELNVLETTNNIDIIEPSDGVVGSIEVQSSATVANECDDIPGENEKDKLVKEIAEESEEGISLILDKLMLSEFKETFQENQINGELLVDIDEEEFVKDLGLTLFQARKLRFFVRGWKPSESEASGADEPSCWSVKDVIIMMESVNLKNFAAFCEENQVDGKLLKEILDERLLQCLRESHHVKLSNFEEKKLKRFVSGGWRPDSSIKR